MYIISMVYLSVYRNSVGGKVLVTILDDFCTRYQLPRMHNDAIKCFVSNPHKCPTVGLDPTVAMDPTVGLTPTGQLVHYHSYDPLVACFFLFVLF